MKDQFGRSINYLRLSVTDRCNLRCRYCMPQEGVKEIPHQDVLRYEELLLVAASACRLGVRKIRVTGGEPLVRRGLTHFITKLCELPEKPEIVLTTNGLLLSEYAETLKSAGLTRVNVSLDTLRPERFAEMTRREGLEKVLAGIAAAEQAGLLPIKINMVPLRGVNDDEIVDFARLTLKHPWDVRFIEFMPISDDLDYDSGDGIPIEEIQSRLLSFGDMAILPQTKTSGPANMYRFPQARGRIGLIPSVTGHFCADCNRLRVMADGRVRGCLLGSQEFDLKPLLRGEFLEQKLDKFLSEIARMKPEKHQLNCRSFSSSKRRMHGIGG